MFSFLKRQAPRSVARTGPKDRVLQVNDRDIPLTIRPNARATRITLRIEPGGRALKMTIPPGLKERDVADFLIRHQGWLEVKLSKFGDDNALRPGGEILIRGIGHRIVHTGQLRGLTEVAEIDGEPVIHVSGMPEHLGRRLATFLKKEARKDLTQYAETHAKAVGKPFRSLSMKDTRSRWGSCSWDGNLSFSWRIVMAPPMVIDYLAAHEVAHLREMNHGPEFWALCWDLCPQMEVAKKWLKRHGSQLHAIDFE
ncbi:MAG: M48 family metallopeptidase [Allorhizobium sp.]